MQLSSKTRLQLQLQKIIFLLLFIACIGLLAWLGNHYNKRWDITSNQRHSLSQNSIDLLNTLNDKVTLNAYVSDDSTRTAVSEIIQRFQQVKTDFQLKFYNPDIDYEQAQHDEAILNNNIAFVIHYKNRHENIPSLGESTISNALLRLSRKDQQSVIFLSGHKERDPLSSDNRSYGKLKQNLESNGYNVDVINLLQNALPQPSASQQTQSQANTILVIAAPQKDLLEGEVRQIQNYINSGGNLLWLSDLSDPLGSSAITKSLGIHFPAGVIVDNNTNLRQTLNIQHPAVIPVIEYPNHAITRQLNYTLFPITRGILINNDNDWDTQPILESLPKSWLETGGILQEISFESSDGDIAGPVMLGLSEERKIKQGEQSTENKNINTTAITQRIVVIGDSDFLSNSHIGAGDNLTLGLRIFSWLSNDDKLLSITPKTSHDLQLQLNDTQLAIIGFGFFLVLPLLLLISGFIIWYRRKQR